MLPKENRLNMTTDIEEVKSKGKKVSGKSLMILVLEKGDKKDSRFGIIVSKNVSKKAVYRNRAKRIIRESINSVLSKVKVGYNVVVIARSNIVGLDFNEVNNDLKNVFSKARII